MQRPFQEFEQQGRTAPMERAYYKSLVVIGAVMAAVCFTLEFVLVDDPFYHGFWSMFAMIGVGMAVVFSYILVEAGEK